MPRGTMPRLRNIRPDDFSGHLMLKTLHDVRFFAGACRRDAKLQQRMIKDFMDNTFRKNALRGRCKEPPLDHRQVLEEARSVMVKNGQDGLSWSIGVEPYSGGPIKDNSGIGGGQGGGHGGSHGGGGGHGYGGGGSHGHGGGHSGGRSGQGSGSSRAKNQGNNTGNNTGNMGGKSFMQMSTQEKVELCCRGFNTSGCSRGAACKFRHQCNRTRSDGKVCWDKSHGATNHT
jgi:hypothetical protein